MYTSHKDGKREGNEKEIGRGRKGEEKRKGIAQGKEVISNIRREKTRKGRGRCEEGKGMVVLCCVVAWCCVVLCLLSCVVLPVFSFIQFSSL